MTTSTRDAIMAAERSWLALNQALACFSDALAAKDLASVEKHRLEATSALESYTDNLISAAHIQ
jgi:hypothetical protein